MNPKWPNDLPPPFPNNLSPPLPDDPPPPIPSESPPPAPSESPRLAPSKLPPAAPSNSSCKSNEPNPLKPIETLKIESIPSFQGVSKLPNSNAPNLSNRDPRILKRMIASSLKNSNDEAVKSCPALPKLISNTPAQVDHNTSGSNPVQSSTVCNRKSTQFVSALHLTNSLPIPLKQSKLPLPSSQLNMPTSAHTPTLSSTLPASLPMKAASGLLTMNSPAPVFIVDPPSGTPQPYLDFAVQKNGTNVQASIQAFNPVSSDILQENPKLNVNSSWNQTHAQASVGPSDCEDSAKSLSANSKTNCSSISQQYPCKDKCNKSVENASAHQVENSTTQKNYSKFSLKETKHHAKEKHFSLEESHLPSFRDEKQHGLSHKKGRHGSSYKDRRHGSSHKERHGSSYKDRRLGSFHIDETHGSSHKDKRHDLPHKDKKHNSPHKGKRHDSSQKDERHDLPHKDERRDLPHKDERRDLSHKDEIHGSPHKDERRDLSHNDEIHGSPHKEEIHNSSIEDEIHNSSHKDEIHNSSHKDEIHNSSHKDEIHGSPHKDEIHNSSHKDDIHGSPHKDEMLNSSHKDEAHGSPPKDKGHGSSRKDERHGLPHEDEKHDLSHKGVRHSSSYKNDRHHSSHRAERCSTSHKIDRHHSSHREKWYYSSHRDTKHHSSHKNKERHSLQNEKKCPSSLKKEKHCRVSVEKSCDKLCESGGKDNIIDVTEADAESKNTDLKSNDTKASPENLCTDSKNNKSERKGDPDSKTKSEKDSSCQTEICFVIRPSSALSRRDRSKRSHSLKYSPIKRKIKEPKESPKKEKRSQERASSQRRKTKLSKDRRSSSKSRQSNDKKQADDRTRNVSNKAKRFKRRRSITPTDLPCLCFKAYKYIVSTAADEYYCPKNKCSEEILAKDPLKELHERFKSELVDRAAKARALKPKYDPPKRKTKLRKPKPPKDSDSDSSSFECESSSDEEDTAMEELERKKKHPDRLHVELWFNDPKEMNDGPLCRCSAKAGRTGIRHGIYVGENHLPLCDPYSNNSGRLHHYRVTMTPTTNFLTKNPTTIRHNGFKYRFEGFSMFSHEPLPQLPFCKVIRFNYEYTLMYREEEFPKNFTVQGLELFSQYLLTEILELVDLNWKAYNDEDGCPRFHFMPRFTRELKDGGKEILAHCHVLDYLLKENKVLITDEMLPEVLKIDEHKWQDLADEVKGMIVTCPGMKPSSIRVDQLDREQCAKDTDQSDFPVIVHFGVRPPQLSYAGNPLYQKAWRDYVKYRHLLANKPKVKYADRHKLNQKESRLQDMRMENDLKRDVTVVIKSKNFYKTGIMSDVIQHAMLLPVLVCHLRFHQSLTHLEKKLGYEFKDRFLLQLALTHPSYRENFGTNPDHARNSLTNCGLRQPQYGDRRIHYMNTRKRGINTLINIMSRFGSRKETISRINHNERLEFLGDAVVEFLSSIHLFYMFPDLEEGGLATYRAAIVQNQHLAVLSKINENKIQIHFNKGKCVVAGGLVRAHQLISGSEFNEKLELDRFMLYAHGSDLCHDLELRHAMANCFEALMGALFLDNGIEIADKVFSKTLFSEPDLLEVWKNFSPHPLQEQEPDGDRKWIESVPLLQRLHEFEEAIGIEFNHIRLLARALTHRSLGYNNLTLGSNQRLEFLGDTVLQLVASEYLYKYFPEHHEGHLSLLRSSLVNNRTQAVVCADLGMVEYAIYPYSKVELKPKDKADLLEAFLGALYVDKDLGYCRKFCEVCFFPRLQDFIMNQDWNDPKSKLQQCCLTLRSMDGGEPDIPTYKVIECKGPTNTRVYSVAVYFQGNRLAVGSGHSIQQAEMDAASNALLKSKDLFPQLRHQRRAIERSLKQGPPKKRKSSAKNSQ